MLRQALIDGEIVEDEIALLSTMRQAFAIDESTHTSITRRGKSRSSFR